MSNDCLTNWWERKKKKKKIEKSKFDDDGDDDVVVGRKLGRVKSLSRLQIHSLRRFFCIIRI